MPASKKNVKKGFFSEGQLPVAKHYVYPHTRRTMLLAGGVVAVLFGGIFLADLGLQSGSLISNGPLSSNHAIFGEECATCHDPFSNVADAKCATCHERFADDLGFHTFAAHYVYRSNDLTRTTLQGDEPRCYTCHTEHQGREVEITRVADEACQSCHGIGRFSRDHPEFAALSQPDPAGLIFPHAIHLAEIRDNNGFENLEAACLSCHTPDEAIENFEPLDFEAHCSDCHLSPGDATGLLPIATAQSDGVWTLAMLRASPSPATEWARFSDPGEYLVEGGQVRKRPLHHADPWVLFNLQHLRRALYPTADAARLLAGKASASTPEGAARYQDAIATLGQYLGAMQGRTEPSVQQELARAEVILTAARARLDNPSANGEAASAAFADGPPNVLLDAAQIAAYDGMVAQLTRTCQTCHLVEQATLVPPQPDQRAMPRAEFDHSAHVIDLGCLDCHNTIPLETLVEGSGGDEALDVAETQNMPGIATCQPCHTATGAGDACITCHLFHPRKGAHAAGMMKTAH